MGKLLKWFGQTATNGINAAFSNSINNAFHRSQARYEFELNEKAAENAYNRQLDFWNKQNDYNDPSRQMSRLREAGLNPGMINGNVVNQAGNLSSVASGGANVSSSSSDFAPADLLTLINQDLNNKLLEKQIDAQDIQNKISNRELEFQNQTFDERVKTISAQLSALNLSNAAAERLAQYEQDAYFNPDGTLNSELNPLANDAKRKRAEAKLAEHRELIENNARVRAEYEKWFKDLFGVDLSLLPEYLQVQVSQYTYHLFEGSYWSDQDYYTVQQLREQVNTWISEEADKHKHVSENTSSTLRDVEAVGEFLLEHTDITAQAIEDFWKSRVKPKVTPGNPESFWWLNNH